MQPKRKAFAASQQEAEQLLKEYCFSIDYDMQWTTQTKWDATVRIACDRNEGIEVAQDTLLGDRQEIQRAANRAARTALVSPAWTTLLAAMNGDKRFNDQHTQNILRTCVERYIFGGEVYLGYGEAFTPAEYAKLQAQWTAASNLGQGAAPSLTQFRSAPPQDKAALGKGNIGATLGTRKWQGNLFVHVEAVEFIMHVDIKK
ncbi:hypothetical protein [Longispora albida]|uniref:hypothetical protein n=1 Tax=Longispora albida TaxID=203523 RepID=UPI000373D94E|nr:hypothetical protein [Longispora albida]